MKEKETGKIAIVEDEPEMAEGLKYNLELEGFEVECADTGEAGLSLVRAWKPDLVILDLMLPGMSGLEVLKILRNEGIWTPIVVLTALDREEDIVKGLEAGADDYVCKPFGLAELLARVKAVMRRSVHVLPHGEEEIILGDGTRINFLKYEVKKGDKIQPLSRFEAEILKYLVSRKGEVVSREDLLKDVWGYKILPQTRTVDNHIARIRKKLEEKPDDPQWILTVHGIGYRFVTNYGEGS